MNRFLYNLVLHVFVAPFLAAYYLPSIVVRGKYSRSIGGKLGKLPTDFLPEALPRPRIWFHAVSVGEAVALCPLVRALKELAPSSSIIVSTGTETGQDKARDSIPDADGFFYLPLDFPEFINPVVQRIRPDLFVLMETELWPNLIHSLKAHGSRIALANGRISDRSFPRYRKLRRFFAPTLGKIDMFLMTSETDGSRIKEMGAAGNKVRVTGNTKYDAIPGNTLPDVEQEMRKLLDLEPSIKVLVAGSTHPGEHEIVLDAYNELTLRFPDLVLILVPRHVEKTPSIISAMAERGMEPPFLRSTADLGATRSGRNVVIVDRMGELFRVFSLASVVFVGGSLVPRGGQNVLEPAAWGKPILFGPSMEDFRDARDILVRCGAGIEVNSAQDLANSASEMLLNPQDALSRGRRGRKEVLKNVGSAQTNAQLLVALMSLKH
jgi:3-deoxy-D-manno-octulosonic-acid transferase